jgi:hypothetical protein
MANATRRVLALHGSVDAMTVEPFTLTLSPDTLKVLAFSANE